MMRRVAVGLSLLFVFVAVGCGKGSVTGTYSLDKAAMTKAMDEKVASLPEAQRGMAKLAAELVKAMDITLVISDGGKGEMKSTMPDLFGKGQPKTKSEPLTWELKGSELTLSGGKKPVKCTVKGNKLHCSDGKDEMIFVKG